VLSDPPPMEHQVSGSQIANVHRIYFECGGSHRAHARRHLDRSQGSSRLGDQFVNRPWNNWINWSIIIVLVILSLILAAQVTLPQLFPGGGS
jgi:Mn2+/Fe2+ NRAMP family transporter